MSKLGTFRDLTPVQRKAAFEAAALLLLARILVALVPLKYWRDRFGTVARDVARMAPAPATCPTVRLVRQAIGRAMRNAPLDFICLPQALAARWMLVRRGIDSALHIGARREPRGEPRFHAWLLAGGQWVTGDCDPRDFSEFHRKDALAPEMQ